jgi:hypothetical protein
MGVLTQAPFWQTSVVHELRSEQVAAPDVHSPAQYDAPVFDPPYPPNTIMRRSERPVHTAVCASRGDGA